MTPYIEAKKTEIAEKWIKIDEQSWNERSQHPSPLVVCDFIEKELDTLLDEIQEAVEKNSHVGAIPRTDEYANGWNDCRKEAFSRKKEAFQHLRTVVETEWQCECKTQLPYFGTKTVDGFIRCQNCKRVYTTAGELAPKQ